MTLLEQIRQHIDDIRKEKDYAEHKGLDSYVSKLEETLFNQLDEAVEELEEKEELEELCGGSALLRG